MFFRCYGGSGARPSVRQNGAVPKKVQRGYVTVEAVSYESLALDTRLSFPPPLADRSQRPEAFAFWWKLMQFVFDLPPPATFPSLPALPASADLDALKRYTKAADDMAESAILGGGDRINLHIGDDGQEHVETNFSSNELARGFTVLFRQFDAKKERASFLQAQRILRVSNAEAHDTHVEGRRAHLTAWGKARGHLRGKSLRVRVGQKLVEQGRMPPGIPGEDGMSPEQLISAYQYGDLIHWGDKREIVDVVSTDPFWEGWQRMLFLDAVAGLAHLYLGFSLVIRAALGSTG